MKDALSIIQSYLTEAPVNIEGIIRSLGVELDKKAELDDDISGQIEKLPDGSYKISVNKNDHYFRQRFTMAHELGHFKHRHVIKRIVVSFAMSLAFLWLLGYLMQQGWFYQGLGVDVAAVPSTAMALLLFFLVMPVFTFLLHPISSLYSRKHEFEADAYAAQNSSADDLIRALVKLYQDNAATLTPDPLHSAFYDSHPPASIRVAHLQSQGQA